MKLFLITVLLYILQNLFLSNLHATENQNTNAIDSLFSLSNEYISLDNSIAKLYAEKAKKLLTGKHYLSGEREYFLIKARIAYYEDEYREALGFLDSLKTILNFEESTEQLARFYSISNSVEFCIGNYQKAVDLNLKAIEIYNRLGDNKGVSQNLNSIGKIYYHQKDYKKAKEYFARAMEANKKTNDLGGYGYILVNIGRLKEAQDSLEQALEYYNRAHKIFVENGILRGIASTVRWIASIQKSQGHYKEAKEKLYEAEDIYTKIEEKFGLACVYAELGEVNREAENYQTSIEYCELAKQSASTIKSDPLLAYAWQQLSKTYKAIGDYKKALEAFESYEKINTDIITWENNQRISNLEHQADLIAKEKDIKLLNQENRLKTLQLYILISIVLLLVLIASWIIIYLRMKNKNLHQQQEILEEKNRLSEVKNQLQEQNQKMLENDLELKNKELTSKALALLQLNETLQDINTKITEFKPENNNLKNDIVREIQRATHNNIWEEFDLAFGQVHNSFYDKLLEICPNLSSTEIKIAALLRLNLSTKEIASISFKSESAVKIARHRIRNKLGLASGENLVPFLLKL